MLDSGQNWELFGYDMRNLGRHWLAAWRDFLWAYDSPVRKHLDEPVLLHDGNESLPYHAGEPAARVDTDCEAVLLPDELVLSRRLDLPAAAEAELEQVIALEVNASSPFSPDDTSRGWCVVNRDESRLQVLLAIASRSAAMAHVGHRYGSHDAQAQEVWARVDDKVLVLDGFGEQRRARHYRQRLVRVSILLMVAAALLLTAMGTAAGFKKLELGRVEAVAARAQGEANAASRYRATLGRGNETVAVINDLTAQYPSPHPELARLTRLLGDDAYVERFSMQGLEIDLRGRSGNAAGLMQTLSEQPEYAEVVAASPIRRIANSDMEQFHLKLKIEGAD
jgi:hypothetical protein